MKGAQLQPQPQHIYISILGFIEKIKIPNLRSNIYKNIEKCLNVNKTTNFKIPQFQKSLN